MDAAADCTATMAQADSEYATNVGASRPDVAWILSDRDVWYRNPAYRGLPVPHPETQRIDFGDWPNVVFNGAHWYQRIKKGEKPDAGFAGGVYLRGKCAIFTDTYGTPRVGLINNRHTLTSGPFFVSCFNATDGRMRFMFATSEADETFFGIRNIGHRNTAELARRISQDLGLIPKPAPDFEDDISY